MYNYLLEQCLEHRQSPTNICWMNVSVYKVRWWGSKLRKKWGLEPNWSGLWALSSSLPTRPQALHKASSFCVVWVDAFSDDTSFSCFCSLAPSCLHSSASSSFLCSSVHTIFEPVLLRKLSAVCFCSQCYIVHSPTQPGHSQWPPGFLGGEFKFLLSRGWLSSWEGREVNRKVSFRGPIVITDISLGCWESRVEEPQPELCVGESGGLPGGSGMGAEFWGKRDIFLLFKNLLFLWWHWWMKKRHFEAKKVRNMCSRQRK